MDVDKEELIVVLEELNIVEDSCVDGDMEEELLVNVEELVRGDGVTMTVEDITAVEAYDELAIVEDEDSNRDTNVEDNCSDVGKTEVTIADEAENEADKDGEHSP